MRSFSTQHSACFGIGRVNEAARIQGMGNIAWAVCHLASKIQGFALFKVPP
jgi:hypothetical protein